MRGMSISHYKKSMWDGRPCCVHFGKYDLSQYPMAPSLQNYGGSTEKQSLKCMVPEASLWKIFQSSDVENCKWQIPFSLMPRQDENLLLSGVYSIMQCCMYFVLEHWSYQHSSRTGRQKPLGRSKNKLKGDLQMLQNAPLLFHHNGN